jgi:hypothetical protein
MIHELRTYICSPGRLGDLLARFERPVLQIWKELGIHPLGFWTAHLKGATKRYSAYTRLGLVGNETTP